MTQTLLDLAPAATRADSWREAVVYRVRVPTFRDGDGDGEGDLAGLVDALPYLDDLLGIGVLHVDPPPRGAALDHLRAVLHARGLRLVVDDAELPAASELGATPWTAAALSGALATAASGRSSLHARTRARPGPQARNAAVLLLTAPGTPLLEAGDELGLADGAAMPWLPGGDDAAERALSVRRQLADPRSMLVLHERLLGLRRAHAALRDRALDLRPTPTGDCLVYERGAGAQRLLVALNLAPTHRVIEVPPDTELLLSTRLDRRGPLATRELVLRGDEGVVAIGLTARC